MLWTLRLPDVINTVLPDCGKLWCSLLVVSGGVCWCSEMAAKCLWREASTLRYVKKIEQHLIVRSSKSETEVTNNRRVLEYCSVEANYWQTPSITRPFWTAELLDEIIYLHLVSAAAGVELSRPTHLTIYMMQLLKRIRNVLTNITTSLFCF